MRISVVCKGVNTCRCGFKVNKIGEIGAVEVYNTIVSENGGKRRFKRRVKKCASELERRGITFCVGDESFLPIRAFGIELLCDVRHIIKVKAAEAVRRFSHVHAPDAEIIIDGGSFSESLKCVYELLHFKKNVCVRNSAFEDISEEIMDMTGVSIRSAVDCTAITVHLSAGEKFITCGELFATYENFRVSFCNSFSQAISPDDTLRLASILEISGFLRESEIKIEYLPKENFKI